MTTKPLFATGPLMGTPGVLEKYGQPAMPPVLQEAFKRHCMGDWGDLDPEDKQSNDDALRYGGRLLSAYVMPDGGKVWIVTEADRSVTTILLPEEY